MREISTIEAEAVGHAPVFSAQTLPSRGFFTLISTSTWFSTGKMVISGIDVALKGMPQGLED